MKKIIIIILIVALVSGILFFIFKKSPDITNYPPEGKTIVAFGDSLVKGLGATEGNDFPSQLSKKTGTPIINMGISGDTTADGLARVEKVIEQDPKIVIMLFGGNDFLRKVSIKETFKNIDSMVAKLQNSGAVVILLGIQGGILADPYEEYFEDIAENRGALYVPNVLKGLFGQKEYMSDTIHPNDAGYERIAQKIYPELQKVLK